MAQVLRALTALSETVSSVPRNHIVAQKKNRNGIRMYMQQNRTIKNL